MNQARSSTASTVQQTSCNRGRVQLRKLWITLAQQKPNGTPLPLIWQELEET